jgi:UDPglucose 6-dehydrogenase
VRIGFAGLSHLGLVSSIATASTGFEVVAYDPDPGLCGNVSVGHLPAFEPGLAELLAGARSSLRVTADPTALRGCDVIFFALDVPTDAEGRSDLVPPERLVHDVVARAGTEAVLVVLSQVPPGFTRTLAGRLARCPQGGEVTLFYQVETLIVGRAVERALHPERFIVGCGDPGAALPTAYRRVLEAFDCPILPMRYESAEIAKIAVNVWLAASVSVANTLAELCEAIGADWSEVVPALKLDRRIGPHAYVHPGLGIAGGNLERDLATVTTLAAELGTDASVVEASLSNSRYRRDWALRSVHALLDHANTAPTIAVWGLAYKPDTSSTKNSPALALMQSLTSFPIRAYDPRVRLDGVAFPNVVQVDSALEACRGASVLAVMTPWAEFSSCDLEEVRRGMARHAIVDPFGCLDRALCAALGFRHLRLGAAVEVGGLAR